MGSQQPRGPRTGIEVDTAALRRARLRSGLSLSEVAGSDLTRQAVHLIETGKVRPTARSLRLIARRLGVPEAALLALPAPSSDERVLSELDELCQRREHSLVLEQARGLLGLGGSPERTAFAHHYAGLALYQLARPSEALLELREARARFETLGNPWWTAESMDWEAITLNMLEDPKALRLGRQALRRYRSLEPRRPETEARVLQHLGTICYALRDYRCGCLYFEEALQVEGGVRELARIARVYHGLGMCYHGLRDHSRAAELLFKTITLYEAEQRITPGPMHQDQPRAENDMGMVLMDQGDMDRAERLFRTALEHYAAAGIERIKSHTLLSLGELRQRQGRLDEALAFVNDAIERAAAYDETFAVTTGYRQLGELHAVRGDHALADTAFQRALALLEEAGLDERAKVCMRAYERVLAERRENRVRARIASA